MDSSSPSHPSLHKRKRRSLPPPSSAFSGTFTRSKSQIYVHSNRSGRARRDASTKPVHRFYHMNGNEIHNIEANQAIPIKDLRARRVFPASPARSQSPSNDGEVEKGEKIDNGVSRNAKSFDFFGGGNGEEKARNDQNVGEEVSAFGGGVQQRKESNSSDKVVANVRQTKVFIAPGSFSYRRLLPFLEDIKPATCEIETVDGKSQNNLSHGNHESHGQKLSDIILNEQSVGQISNDEKIRDAESHKFGVPSNTERDILGIVNNDADPVFGDSLLNNKQINGDIEQLKGPNSGNKMVSNFRPRKVFKPPGSFSYRRLLPFLEDTEEDQTTSLKIEMVNEKSPNNLNNRNPESCDQDASIMALNEQSVMEDCTGDPCKGSSESSYDERTHNAGSHEFGVQPIAELDISGAVNNDADSVFGLMNNEILKNDMDDPTRVNDLMEELLQSTPEQDIQLLVNNHVDTAFGDTILSSSDPKNYLNGLTGVNDSSEEYVQSILEQDLSLVVKNIADTVFGDPDGMTGVSDLQEVDVQMTPPDAVIFTTPEIECNPQNTVDKDCATKSIPPQHTSNSVIDTNGMCTVNTPSVNANQSIVTPSKIGTVLNPCSRQRVFKPSSSFSYRRLLPYLTSVSGDRHPGLVKTSKEGSSMNHFKPASSSEMKETGENKDNQTVLTPTPNVTPLNTHSGSNSSDPVAASVTSASIGDHVKVLDMQSEEPLQSVNIESNSISKLNPEFSFGKDVSLHGVNQNTVLTDLKKEVSQNELDGNGHDLNGHDFMLVDNEQLNEAIIPTESPSKNLLLNPLSHGNGSQRGILKRNPRGCRGLCDCLHCASFRLHADRAFEFSRNQLQDAEEVASNLMKELSSIRHVLECSMVEATDQTVIHLNQLQVMEACLKAVEAEKLAKERLNELNDDLNHHCRAKSLSRPRVAFISKSQEMNRPLKTQRSK